MMKTSVHITLESPSTVSFTPFPLPSIFHQYPVYME
jgi:hypothetical protein